MSDFETLPLVRLPYGFKKRILLLISLAIVNKYVKICSVINKFRPRPFDAHEQVYITDNRVVRREAERDTLLFRFLKCLDQFKFWRKTRDEDILKPIWKSVLLVDEVVHKKKKIYVDDTLILNCQIPSYEKVIPKIFGPYTRLVLHGNIRWSQAKRLIHPDVKQIRMEASMQLPNAEYDDFVDFVIHQNRSVEYQFSFSNKRDYSVDILTRLKNACRNHETRYAERPFRPDMFHLVNRYQQLDHFYYAGSSILMLFMTIFIIPMIFLFVPGGVISNTPDSLADSQLDRILFSFITIIHVISIFNIAFFSVLKPMDIISTDITPSRFNFERFIFNIMYSAESLYNDVFINLKLFYVKFKFNFNSIRKEFNNVFNK